MLPSGAMPPQHRAKVSLMRVGDDVGDDVGDPRIS